MTILQPSLGSSPLGGGVDHDDASGNPLFVSSPRYATTPTETLRDTLESMPLDVDVLHALLALDEIQEAL